MFLKKKPVDFVTDGTLSTPTKSCGDERFTHNPRPVEAHPITTPVWGIFLVAQCVCVCVCESNRSSFAG